MAMKVTFLGDVHGRWVDLANAMNKNSDTEVFIQVGDFGIFPRGGHMPNGEFDTPLLFIDGNHDDHWYLKQIEEKGELEIIPNCFYVPRGSTHRIGDAQVNFLGGAISIDKHFRTYGVNWWPEEEPDREEYQRFIDLPEADIFVTHEAPLTIVEKIVEGVVRPDPVSNTLEFIFREVKKPEIWIFGHHHVHFDETIDGTRFICIPCVHDHQNIKGYKGLTLSL